jgi:predicted transcriptional regulator
MSYQQLVTRKALEGESIERFMNKDPVTVRPSITIRELVEDYIYPHYYKFFPVVDSDGKLMGCISTKQIKAIEQVEWDQHTVGEAATGCSDENTIAPNADPVEALSAMRQNNISRLMVVKDDQLVGIITLKDMLEFLNLKIELEL